MHYTTNVKVVDERDSKEEPLPVSWARLEIPDLNLSLTTKRNGKATISSQKAGEYLMTIRHANYRPKNVYVSFPHNGEKIIKMIRARF